MQTLLPALEHLVREINDMKGALLAEWERSTVKIAMAIASRIIRREVEHDPQISLEVIREALRLAAGSAEIKLHVNPSDYTNLGSQLHRVAATMAQIAPSEIIADASVSPGGCRVETKHGEIDQQIETQLCRIEEELN